VPFGGHAEEGASSIELYQSDSGFPLVPDARLRQWAAMFERNTGESTRCAPSLRLTAMTADYYPFDHAFLGRVVNRIINEVRGINRVTYDITSKPPGTIKWE
jgi:hypothetical protein